jgi:6-phosphofructokinase 1
MRRFGILTGGGDCPGLNAVIRAVVRTVHPRGGTMLGICNGFAGLVLDDVRELGVNDVSGILPRGGTILGSSNRDDPFAWKGDIDGVRYEGDVSARALATARQHDLEGIIVVGGDGTQLIGHRLMQRGLPAIGVPKTIDNDLEATDRTFGFDTAVSICSDAIDRLHTTAESHHRVMFVEVMGRDTGWIALHAGLAAGADVILLPEIPFRADSVLAAIRGREARGKRFSIVCVAEGARLEDGERVYQGGGSLGGVAHRIAERLVELGGIDARTTMLGHVQRGGTPTAFDRVLATRLGVCAAEEALAGRWGTLAALRGDAVVPVPIADAVARQRRVDPRGELVRTARATGVRFGDE